MAKTKLTPEQLEEVTRIQERDGITRKSAIRKYQRQAKAAAKVEAKTKRQRTKVAKSKPEKLTPTEAGKARAEGLAFADPRRGKQIAPTGEARFGGDHPP